LGIVVQGSGWSKGDYSIGFEAVKGEIRGIQLVSKTYEKIGAYDIINRIGSCQAVKLLNPRKRPSQSGQI
jgi:hypothetical protein